MVTVIRGTFSIVQAVAEYFLYGKGSIAANVWFAVDQPKHEDKAHRTACRHIHFMKDQHRPAVGNARTRGCFRSLRIIY